MMGLTVITWIRFFVWLFLGLLIYASYSRRHSEFAGNAARSMDVERSALPRS